MSNLLIFAVISALIGAILGKVFKERPGAGAILALCFGPLGWLAVFVIEDGLRPCPDCKGHVAKDATTCRHCRAALKPSPPPPEIGAMPKLLRFLGLLGLVVTVIALAVNNANPHATDGGMMTIGLIGMIPSFLLFGIGFLLSQYQYNNPTRTPAEIKKIARQTQRMNYDPIPDDFHPPPRKNTDSNVSDSNDIIKLQCKCGSNLNAKPSLSGRTLKCPKCNQPVTVP